MKQILAWLWVAILFLTTVGIGLLAFTDFGTQVFGSRAKTLSGVTFVFLTILSLIQLRLTLKFREIRYLNLGIVVFLIPLLSSPIIAQMGGSSDLAQIRVQNGINTLLKSPGPNQLPITNPFTNGPVVQIEPKKKTPTAAATKIENKVFIENLDKFYTSPEDYVGQKISFEGLLIPFDSLDSGIYLAAKLAIVCCPGDGMPLGICARLPKGFNSTSTDFWYELSGVLSTYLVPEGADAGLNFVPGDTVPLFIVDVAKPKAMPADPYLYP